MTEKVSKPTLFRDLRSLISLDLVKSSGRGKATTYYKVDRNPFLFDFSVFDHLINLFTSKEVLELDKIHKNLSEQLERLDKTIAKRELERFVIELAWKSSQIEGNTYSLLETETLIKTQKEAAGHTKEEATMILNHKSAFDTIMANKDKFRILNLSDITQLHNVLIENMNVTPGIRKHPLEKALIIMSVLAYIQPFGDGNKRTSRMFANAILLAHNYFPLSYRAVSEIDYKKALISFYEQNSLVQLKKILIQQYEFVLNNYFRT